MHKRNIEIKARCRDHERMRNLLLGQGADYRGTDHQIDTYFDVGNGRLKLREGTIENALIHYERDDMSGPKESNVLLYDVQADSPIKEILLKVFDVLVVVDKCREIYFIDNVKFHLDRVDGLGEFVEIEAIDGDGSRSVESLHSQCRFFMDVLGITQNDLLTGSYSTMLLALLAAMDLPTSQSIPA